MSRFSTKDVNEELNGWKISKHSSGRKIAHNTIDGRDVSVWVSDLKGFDGYYPIMGKYLLPYPKAIIEDEVPTGSEILWVTKDQYQRMTRCLEKVARSTVFDQIVPLLGKVFKRIGDFIVDKVNINDEVVEIVLDMAFQKILSELDELMKDV